MTKTKGLGGTTEEAAEKVVWTYAALKGRSSTVIDISATFSAACEVVPSRLS
jgi:hypothetical protein